MKYGNKANLSTKAAPISQNLKLLRIQKVARNEKSCSKYEKLPSNLWKAVTGARADRPTRAQHRQSRTRLA